MKTQVIEKLNAFYQAARELQDVWEEADSNSEENVLNCNQYPFKGSFDEVVNEIHNWVLDNKYVKKATFHTYIMNEEFESTTLEWIENKLWDYMEVDVKASPTIYLPEQLPEVLGLSDEDKDLYSHVLLYNVNSVYHYIGILK